MKKIISYQVVFVLFTVAFLPGCRKNYTNYYPDKEDEGLAIFSNTGNNLMTCFIDGKAWRTIDRTSYSSTQTSTYELEIVKRITSGSRDTLSFHWQGHYNTEKYLSGTVTLVLSVPKNFDYRSLSALNGQRLEIDSAVNGFFSTSISNLSVGNPKGNGSIYFHQLQLDSISPVQFSGHMAGLLDANFPLFNITRGRFDEVLDDGNVEL